MLPKPTKNEFSKRNLLYIILFSILLLALIYFFRYPEIFIRTVSSEKASEIIPSNYSAYTPGTTVEFFDYTNPNVTYTNKIVYKHQGISEYNGVNKGHTLGAFFYSGSKVGALEFIKTLDMSQDSLIGLSLVDSNDLTFISEFTLKNSPKWNVNSTTTKYLTSTNKTVKTIAGTFDNCLEVITIHRNENRKTYYTTYMAPSLGYILEKSGSSLFNQKISWELSSYNIPNKLLDNNIDTDFLVNTNTKQLSSNIYVDNLTKIKITLPNTWTNNYAVQENKWSNDVVKNIDFYGYEPSHIYKLFSIAIFDNNYSKEYIEKNTPYRYLKNVNGHNIGAYVFPPNKSDIAPGSIIDSMRKEVYNIIDDIILDK